MRISEWSSDVCSSDLHNANRKKASRMRNCPNCRREVSEEARYCRACYTVLPEIDPAVVARDRKRAKLLSRFVKISIIAAFGGAVWPMARKSVVLVKGVSVGLGLGGRLSFKKHITN